MLRKHLILTVAALAVAAFAAGGAAWAENPAPMAKTQGLKRIPLQKVDVPPGERIAVSAVAEAPPNANVARHTHPGPEIGYVIEGELTLSVAGQPDRHLKAGDSFNIPQNTPHAAVGGPQGFKVLSVYIVEKDKPLASPAPK